MSVYIVSDLHVWGPEDPIYTSLLSLIRTRAQPGDTLVLAGDIFDLFVGDKPIYRVRYSAFFEALDSAGRRGVAIHYIEGNHDFQITRAFRNVPRLVVHPGDVSLEVAGKKFFISHGDLADSTDYGYRFLRAFFRSPIMKFLLWIIPGKWLDDFGKWSSGRSRGRNPVLLCNLPVEKMESLRNAYRSFAAERLAQGYDFVAMGHCHDLDEKFFQVGGRPGQYVNVGFPRVHGSFLTWSPGDEKIQREKLP